MKKFALFLAILAVPAIALISCSKNSPTAPSLAPDQGKMMFALDAADNIATGQVTITKGALTHVLPITITDHSGTVTFAGIQVGHWNILVQLFDADGVEIYTGTGEAIVTKDATTTVTIRVEHNTGTLIINVEVPASYQIVFASDRLPTGSEIFTIDSNGNNLVRLTNMPNSPKHSANNFRGGNIFVFCDRNTSDFWEAWQMNLDGSNCHDVSQRWAERPRWSWDGSKIAAYHNSGTYNVFVINPDGSNFVELTDNSHYDSSPCWTPDNRILWGHSGAIFIMNADGSNKQAITDYSMNAVPSDCSYDYKILFYSDMDGDSEIYSINIDGTGLIQLTDNNSEDLEAHYSADCQKIVFYSNRDGNWEIYIMSPDGSGQTNITNNPASDHAGYFVF